MLEFYTAYSTYEDMMNLTEDLIIYLVKKLFKSLTITYQGETLDFSTPWKRVSLVDSLKDIGGVPEEILTDSKNCSLLPPARGLI